MNISPTLRPLLDDLLGADAANISDDLIRMVARAVSEVKYLDAVLGDAYEVTPFSRYQLN